MRVRGSLKTPPENEEFSYRDYLARQGIHSYMSTLEVTVLPGNGGNLFFRSVYKLKAKLLENTYRLYQDPEASLLAGILFGVDTGMTKELQNAFKNTGTAHIIAISGFNIAIIAGIFFSIFKNIFGERIRRSGGGCWDFLLHPSRRRGLGSPARRVHGKPVAGVRVNWDGATTA